MKVKTVKCPIGSTRECEEYKVCNFFVSVFFLVFFKIDFFKTKIFICFNSPGLFVHLLCLSLVQEDFRTGFIFIVALTKKKCLPLKLFLRQIGPNWGSGLSKTIVTLQHHITQENVFVLSPISFTFSVMLHKL